jgi:hypothetical protein
MELETWSTRFSYILFLGGFALVEKWDKSGDGDWIYKLINRFLLINIHFINDSIAIDTFPVGAII